ncbi:autotransporter domain-containing protein [Cetobacterium sp. 2A]|uniref:autotransporter family protein n=1 Tax=Cetobacterium sp. 2A TaxID=2754723 RepID=UPI00163C54C6|nr:autotransporter domain-containing protein [Cetobacterium sp. 2A]MBC2856869.1 autotransporter domain-containing protein [Cetobacterium sp. 2A]
MKKLSFLLSLFISALPSFGNTVIYNPIYTDGNYGYRVISGDTFINNSTIANNGNYGIYSIGNSTITNNGTISNDGTYGLIVYDNSNLVQNSSTGVIDNKGNYGFYGRNSTDLKNLGIIKNKGSYGFFLDSGSSGINDGIIENSGNSGAAIYSSKFINNGSIKNGGSYGIYLSNGSSGINYGSVKNKGNIGVYVSNSSTFINHGEIISGGPIAILLGTNDSLLTLGTASNIVGSVEGNKGTNTLYLVDSSKENPKLTSDGKINFNLKNFSNITVNDGTWHLQNNSILTPPSKSNIHSGEFNLPPFPTSDTHGTFIIDNGVNLTFQIGINDKSTSTLVANNLINNGTITEKPLDSIYITNSDNIRVPILYVNPNELESTSLGNIQMVNIAKDWSGKYEFKDGILYLILDRNNENPIKSDQETSFLGGYYTSIFDYPQNNIPFINNSKLREKNYSWNRENFNEKTQYIDIISSYGKYSNGTFNPDYSYSSYGIEGITVYPINKNLHWSLGYGYVGNDVKYKNLYSTDEFINNFSLLTSVTHSKNNFISTFQAGIGYSDHSLKRKVEDRDDENIIKLIRGDYKSILGSLGGEFGYSYSYDENILVYPYVGLDYVWDKKDNYKEKQDFNNTGGLYSMDISSSLLSTPISKIGLKTKFNTSGYNISADFSWNHRFNDYESYGSYFNFKPDVKFDINGLKVGKDSAVIALDINKELKNNTKVNLGLYSSLSEKSFDASISLGLAYSF